MAYVNVAEWSPDQVTEWLKGLDNVIFPYVNLFLKHEVRGQQLLNMRADDLEYLGVGNMGHQELVLEALEHLRNFHYELDRENLQYLALKLSCAAQSLYNELKPMEDMNKVKTQTMSDVTHIISLVKPLVSWLDRTPFSGQLEYNDKKLHLLKLSFRMATLTQRDTFAERPIADIKDTCYDLAQLADNIIRDIVDPMILQPASLDLVTLKKREDDLGFFLVPSFQPVHQISEIKFGSPAHTSGKIEQGDEIVQVNYQTVVGWQRKKVLLLFQESPPDLLLTLKKRPKHTKIYGQIYMKPYRLPSKKRALPYTRWHDSIPSPRPELLTIPNFDIPIRATTQIKESPQIDTVDSDSEDDSDSSQQVLCPRVYPLKPRPVLQRRNTITGTTPSAKGSSIVIEQFWRELKTQASYKHSTLSFSSATNDVSEHKESLTRDKSASYGHGLELNTRPCTILCLSNSRKQSLDNRNGNQNSPNTKDDLTRKSSDCDGLRRNEELCSPNRGKKKIGVRFEDVTIKREQKPDDFAVIDVINVLKNDDQLQFIDENEDEVYDRSGMEVFCSQDKDDGVDCNTESSSGFIEKDELVHINVKSRVNNFENKINKLKSVEIRSPINSRQPDESKPPQIPPKPDVAALKKPAVPPRRPHVKHLDKSHSTPAYDTTDTDNVPNAGFATPFNDEAKKHVVNEIPLPAKREKRTVPAVIPKSANLVEVLQAPKLERRQSNEPLEKPPTPPPRPLHTLNCDSPGLNPRAISTPKSIISEKAFDFEDGVKDAFQVFTPETFQHSPLPSPVNVNFSMSSKTNSSSTSTATLVSNDSGNDVLGKCELASNPSIKSGSSVVKAILSKGKSVKKKNSLILKRRRVSVKDVVPGEIQGYLYQRIRVRATQMVNWDKRWFVLNGSGLYGFTNKESTKAECVIFLPGLTVSKADEVKSRPHAFKVYHTGTAFYFSAENYETMITWIDLLTGATNTTNELTNLKQTSDTFKFYSESDDDSDGKPTNQDDNKKFSSLKKFTKISEAQHLDNATATSTSTSLDRKCLRFLSNIYDHSGTNNRSKTQNVPVPTAQYRSYRKVTAIHEKSNEKIKLEQNETNSPRIDPSDNHEQSERNNNFLRTKPVNRRNHTARVEPTDKSANEDTNGNHTSDVNSNMETPKFEPKKMKKPKPYNYIHASNPSLYDNSDFKPIFLPKKMKPMTRNDNLSSCITLKQFMLNRQEEERRRQHNLEVGDDVEVETRMQVLPESVDVNTDEDDVDSLCTTIKDEILCEEVVKPHKKLNESFSYPSTDTTDSKSDSKTLCRKYSDSGIENKATLHLDGFVTPINQPKPSFFDAEVMEIKPESDKKNRVTKILDLLSLSHDHDKYAKHHPPTPKHKNRIIRQSSLTTADRNKCTLSDRFLKRSKSPSPPSSKKDTVWLCSSHTYPEQLSNRLKPTVEYTPMIYSGQNSRLQQTKFELNLDDKSTNHGRPCKFRNIFASTSSGNLSKEKTLLGSPRLHRAIFRKTHSSSVENDNRSDDSIKESMISFKTLPNITHSSVLTHDHTTCINKLLESTVSDATTTIPVPDYPDLVYPPVFEAETYSFANPSTCSLMRKESGNKSRSNI